MIDTVWPHYQKQFSDFVDGVTSRITFEVRFSRRVLGFGKFKVEALKR